jgi:hypothetical protein
MQQTKITKTLGEFQKFLENDNKTGLCLEDTLRFFDIQRIFGHFECIKQRGIKVTLIMTSLMVMLFYRSRNIHSYFSRQFGKYTGTDSSKESLLRSFRQRVYLLAIDTVSVCQKVFEPDKPEQGLC